MQKTDKEKVCFRPKGTNILLCNAVDRDGDGQLWETKSGKWIPISIEDGEKNETATTSDEAVAVSKKS
jgi:hypothetical protein